MNGTATYQDFCLIVYRFGATLCNRLAVIGCKHQRHMARREGPSETFDTLATIVVYLQFAMYLHKLETYLDSSHPTATYPSEFTPCVRFLQCAFSF